MNKKQLENRLSNLGKIINEVHDPITFNMLEIGALPLGGKQEPFYQLLGSFPGSRIIAFEVDEKLCKEQNEKAPPGVEYHSTALGRSEEVCTFYETTHPMCCSLYKPDDDLLANYQNMEVAMLKSTGSIETQSLDHFIGTQEIDNIDFIKIDVQGAELDIFKGGTNTLKDVVTIVCEVEFIPLYIGQPLFGDVCEFLTKQNLIFHKFLGICGRTLKPIIMQNNKSHPSQHMWSDAVYIKNVLEPSQLAAEKLLKMAVLALIYGSPDVTIYCLMHFDKKIGTDVCKRYNAL